MSRPRVSYLVLGYNRPQETRDCLISVRANSHFAHELVFLSNGGEQKHAWSLYNEGLIDRIIFNRRNNGLGFGTTDLFRFCDTEFAIYVQNDQIMRHVLEQAVLDNFIRALETDRSIGAIGLAGFCAGVNVYSERPHLINVACYNSIPNKPNGGCGPRYDLEYNEGYIQRFFRDRELKYVCVDPPIFEDHGRWSVRENPCGGISRIEVSTGGLWWDRIPRSKYLYPNLNDREWADSIQGKWVEGAIPEANR